MLGPLAQLPGAVKVELGHEENPLLSTECIWIARIQGIWEGTIEHGLEDCRSLYKAHIYIRTHNTHIDTCTYINNMHIDARIEYVRKTLSYPEPGPLQLLLFGHLSRRFPAY